MLTAIGLGAFVLLGCACASNRTSLREAVEDFTRSVRWGDWERSSAYQHGVTPEVASQDLRVTDVALGAVVAQQDETAIITLSVEWYRLTEGTILRSVVRQQWKRRDGAWSIRAQRLLQGPPFPFLPETHARVE